MSEYLSIEEKEQKVISENRKEFYIGLLKMCQKFMGNNIKRWTNDYLKKAFNIEHDEPWVTLMSMLAAFYDEKSSAMNLQKIMNNAGFGNKLEVDSLDNITLEKQLPEIQEYKRFLYNLKDSWGHMYPDRNDYIQEKFTEKKASMEGNTNLDSLIEFTAAGKKCILFTEAKFLSDIDTKTKYNPVRNQIIRNIDAMLDFEDNDVDIADRYFCMLTPQVFRTELFGGGKPSILDSFNPQHGRYYCWLMNHYKNPVNIARDLPHRKLSMKDWETIADNIGWITYESFYKNRSIKAFTNEHIEFLDNFFSRRQLI